MTAEAKSEGTQMTEAVAPQGEDPTKAFENPVKVGDNETSEEPKTAAEEKIKGIDEENKPNEPKSEEKSKVTMEKEDSVLVEKNPTKAFEEPVKVVDNETSEEPKTAAEEKRKGTDEENKPNEPKSEEKSKVTMEKEDSVLVGKCSSFKEESNILSDLKEHERKALIELRTKLEEAILNNNLLKKEGKPEKQMQEDKEVNDRKSEGERDGEKAKPDTDAEPKATETTPTERKEMEFVSLWGVPLFSAKSSESADVVLLKFLRARDFKVKEAFEMLKNTLQWRKESNPDSILDEELFGEDLCAAFYMDGVDREGHPVCYNVSGVFQDDGLYQKAFGTEDGRAKFLRWRVHLMEKGIKKLDLRPGGATSLLQITDLMNSPGPSKKELRSTMKQAVQLLQDNYPEFVARNIFINVPFWYYAFYALISPFLTQRTRSKMVFARPAKVTETLLKYIPAEAIPIHYGGLKRENDTEFSADDCGVSELTVKAGSTETVEVPALKAGTTLLWDLTVLGWEVNYKEEFVPADEGSYTIIIKKGKKMGYQEEPIRNSFRNNEPGKVVLTIENSTFKKKKILFRYKTRSS